MAISFKEANISNIRFAAQTQLLKLGMKMSKISHNDKPLQIKLYNVDIPFEPSVFNGRGQETRKNIVFAISEDAAQYFGELEETCKRAFDSPSKVAELWCSSLKHSDEYPTNLKAKISTDKVLYFTPEGEPTSEPTAWKRLRANVIITVRGVYETKSCSGLLIDTHAIQYEQADGQEPISCPF